MTVAISSTALGKRFRIGTAPRHSTLRDAIAAIARSPLQGMRRDDNEVWALRQASFEVRQGEVVGLIGRNGAGKSTLLKILSRITDPTEGRADIRGRIASLLEVGTGFHPELTGRENIYLNGAILGMRRRDTARRFDEIVAFAGTGQFLDTPVKQYSSGMYMRLAFAVAAHLEPDILVVDEVLAVGDGAFQRRCLGRMQHVAGDGRTVLFVSHNMDAVRRLCSRVILLQHGRIVADGEPDAVIAQYLAEDGGSSQPGQSIDLSLAERVGSGEARFTAAQYSSGDPRFAGHPYPQGPLTFTLSIESDAARTIDSMAVKISSPGGTKLIHADVMSLGETIALVPGGNVVTVTMHQVHLTPGLYAVGLRLGGWWGRTMDHVESAFNVEVVDAAVPGFGTTDREDGLVPCSFGISQALGVA
jgi:lipopolysaccharide transport system ATP-binding protein